MPPSVASRSVASPHHSSDEDEHQADTIQNTLRNSQTAHDFDNASATESLQGRRNQQHGSSRTSHSNLRVHTRPATDELASLLGNTDGPRSSGYRTMPASLPATPRISMKRSQSYSNSIRARSRRGSVGGHGPRPLGGDHNNTEANHGLASSKPSVYVDDRLWYDQFTSTDWVHDSIADAFRRKELRSRKDFKGRLQALFDGAQGWILVAIIGCITAGFAFLIDVSESTIFDYKTGYCTTHWWYSKRQCCEGVSECKNWCSYSDLFSSHEHHKLWVDYIAYIAWVVVLSILGCLVTLQTKTSISSAISLTTLDENLGAERQGGNSDPEDKGNMSPTSRYQQAIHRPPITYYPAAGSGVAEVRVILSGFVLHGYLGARTLICKTVGLILSVASGLSIGKEGPFVHIATCIGNILTRFSPKYALNDAKRREVLSAAAASGVAVAFGAPIGGVLFSLEEVSYYFPPKTLFRTFFCCIAAALSLKFLNPYGTNKIVLFQVKYTLDWKFFEIFAFATLGVLGGLLGALFIKASRFWAKTFRRLPYIKKYPMLEVVIVAIVTGLVGFWNRYTKIPVAELLYELAAPCDSFSNSGNGLCPTQDRIPQTIWYLIVAFVVKAILTTITFGIKVPAGIYVPSMVVGGLLGRIVGHTVQLIILRYPNAALFAHCPKDGAPESCVVPGVYALVAAGATMCGVTRLSVTLAVILFEMTGSLDHVLPFSLGVLIAKWTADALEPLSIYDLLTDMNAYPYLDHKVRPMFTTDLGDITPPIESYHYIDISASPLVPVEQLRGKLTYMHMAGEIDGGLPIIKDEILVGLIPAPDLEYALDRIEPESESGLCLMSPHHLWFTQTPRRAARAADESAAIENDEVVIDHDVEGEENHLLGHHAEDRDGAPADFTPYIDPSPVSLDMCSPMDLVYECFVKLGLRYICVLRQGKFAGMVHKKTFVRYVKREERKASRHGS